MLRFPCIHSDIPRGNKQGERNEVMTYSFLPFAWVKGFFPPSLANTHFDAQQSERMAGWLL